MTDVYAPNIQRDGIGGNLFADITAAPVVGVVHGPDGIGLTITFDDAAAPLTNAQMNAVVLRCASPNANAEELRRRAAAATVANRNYLAIPTPSQAQATAQVAALTRQVNALIRFALQEFDGTE